MNLQIWLNAFGLVLITVGGIGAARCAPTVQYNLDGSVSLSGQPDRAKRVRTAKMQRALPFLLASVGIGALIQLIAMFVPADGGVAVQGATATHTTAPK